MSRPAPPSWQVWTALWLVDVLWGSTYLAIAYVVGLLRWLVDDRPSGRTVAGVALGFVGLAVLLLPGARPDDVAG